jgi:hypothetical protein
MDNNLKTAILDAIRNTDLNDLGDVKPHMKDDGKGNKVETGKAFYRGQLRASKGFPLTIGGETYYTDQLDVTISGFNLYKDAPEVKTVEAKPATANADKLAKFFKPASSAPVVVPAEKK